MDNRIARCASNSYTKLRDRYVARYWFSILSWVRVMFRTTMLMLRRIAFCGMLVPVPVHAQSTPDQADILVDAIIASATDWPDAYRETLAPLTAAFEALDYHYEEEQFHIDQRAEAMQQVATDHPAFDTDDPWLGSHMMSFYLGQHDRLYSACVRLSRGNYNLMRTETRAAYDLMNTIMNPTADAETYETAEIAWVFYNSDEGKAFQQRAVDRMRALPGLGRTELSMGEKALAAQTEAGLNCFAQISIADPDEKYIPAAVLAALQERFVTVAATELPPIGGQQIDIPIEIGGSWDVSSLNAPAKSDIEHLRVTISVQPPPDDNFPRMINIRYVFVSTLATDPAPVSPDT